MRTNNRLWRWLGLVFVLSFGALGYLGWQIYLAAPPGDYGLWSRLADMQHDALFVWGRRDRLVPIGFMKHVERTFPAARHLELDCGHVPQIERPFETHDAMRAFLS